MVAEIVVMDIVNTIAVKSQSAESARHEDVAEVCRGQSSDRCVVTQVTSIQVNVIADADCKVRAKGQSIVSRARHCGCDGCVVVGLRLSASRTIVNYTEISRTGQSNVCLSNASCGYQSSSSEDTTIVGFIEKSNDFPYQYQCIKAANLGVQSTPSNMWLPHLQYCQFKSSNVAPKTPAICGDRGHFQVAPLVQSGTRKICRRCKK